MRFARRVERAFGHEHDDRQVCQEQDSQAKRSPP